MTLYNRFHAIVFFTWQFSLNFALQNLFPIFSNFIPKWKCSSENSTSDFSYECDVYEKCSKEFLHFEEIFYSNAFEYKWICSESALWYPWALSTLQFFGVFMGTIVFGSLADRFGRKPISICILSQGISMLALSSLTFEWWQYFITRFFIGMSVGGTLVVIFTYCIELVLPEQRLSLQVYANWGTARVILTLVCYFFPDWRHASFVCCLTSLPALLIIIFVYPESPMWLLTKENIEEFKKSQHRIQKISGEDLVELPQIEKQEKVTLKTLWSSSRVLIVFLTLCFSWFTVSVSNFALDLYSPSIIGDFFTNQFAFALILMASKFVMGVIDQAIPQFDRRMLHNYNQLIAAICFGVVAVLLVFNYENIFVLILSIIGLFTVEYTWDACYLVTVESMPTGIRSTALGICSTIARVGMMTAPLLVTLSSFWKPTVYTAMAIFGFVNVVSAWYFLPETKGVDLAEVNLEKSAKISPSESSISV